MPAAAWDLAPSSHAPSTGGAWQDEQQDFLGFAHTHHRACQARRAYWPHTIPPYRTSTRSQWSDKWGVARPLWSDTKPEGFDNPVTEAANELARIAALPVKVVTECRCYFSVAYPWDSSTCVRRLSKALL